MKKIIFRVGIAIAVLFVLALVVVFFSLNTIVKKGVETVGPMMTKVEVKLGAAEISPFSGSGRLTKLFVGNPEGYKTPSAIEVGDIKLSVSPGSLMSDTIVINELNIQNPVITLEGSLTGNNLTKILDNLSSGNTSQPKPKDAAPTANTSKSSKKFIVKDLVLNGVKVNLNLDIKLIGAQAMTIPIPAVHLQNIGTAENGVTAEELMKTIMKPLLANITISAGEAIAGAAGQLKDLGKNGVSNLGDAAKGLGNLFKKK